MATFRTAFVCLSLVPTVLIVGGCQTRSETFGGKPTDQVWTAMVKAAEQPDYKDWHVIENDVWTDEASGRIEIWRLLRRYKDPPGQWSRLEDYEWKFAIVLDSHDPPTASFAVRSMCVPSHSWMEAERYFDQVWSLLGGRPALGDATPTPKEEPPVPSDTGNPAKPTPPADPTPVEPPVDLPS